jgi:type II secretory pathway pseudopilin PulG
MFGVVDRPSSRLPAARRVARAFTLLELINFLALAAILSALGMYALARYVRHSKTAEAFGSVTAIAAASVAYYTASDMTQPLGAKPDAARAMRHFPPSSRSSVPPKIDAIRGRRYQSSRDDWAPSPWRELAFSIPQPQYYAYSYESQGSGPAAHATVTAQGDLDADGILSSYRISVAADDSFTARISGPVQRVDAEE